MITNKTQTNSHGTHGGEVIRLAQLLGVAPESILDFSSNANSLCDDLTRSVLDSLPLTYQRYPDSDCTALRQRIARHEHADAEQILAGNGSSELIYLALQTLRPARVLMVAPIFSEYARACDAFGIGYKLFSPTPESGFDVTEADMLAIRQMVATYQPDMAILCTPNNPACTAYSDIARLIGELRSPYILIDNSYLDFLWGTNAYVQHEMQAYQSYAAPESRIISLRSMTKFFYCTGIRLGYCHSDAETISRMEPSKTPWSVWEIAQQAGMAFIDRIDEYRSRLPEMRKEKREFAKALQQSGAFADGNIFEGANFVTAGLNAHLSGKVVYQKLLKQGMLVRLCDNIPGMPANFIRMQAREKAAWLPLTEALSIIVKHTA
ncbi:pyridoxal phosphate-dependent aminotransferase [Oleidesulfovibrio sp.]|uniref:pyridoxal phosphate-dependent aminotransferase n=1 Tax=Oleidesulfovibrio sp. TaxID=2909707 RepID=UPI003A8B2BAC